jgi:hypothetical protein
MTANPHFEPAANWREAAALVAFTPLELVPPAPYQLQSLQAFVMNHRGRRLPIEERTLEAHYGAFVFSQSRHTPEGARHLALELSYGSIAREALVAGHEARTYELGPEPPPDDIDPRPPAVVTWHDGTMFYLLASDQLPVATLEAIAASLYRA